MMNVLGWLYKCAKVTTRRPSWLSVHDDDDDDV